MGIRVGLVLMLTSHKSTIAQKRPCYPQIIVFRTGNNRLQSSYNAARRFDMERLRLKVGDYELEVEGEQAFIDKHLAAFERRIADLPTKKESLGEVSRKTVQRTDGRSLSPAEFYKQKRPDGGTKTLVVLASYLRDHRGQATFKRSDINTLCEEVRIKHIHGQYYTLAVQQGLLMEANGGFNVTLTGDELVNGMGEMQANAVAS